VSKRQLYLPIYCNSIQNSYDTESTYVSIDNEWMKKMWYMYTMECHSVIQYEWIPSFAATGTELENITLRKKGTERQIAHISLICGRYKVNWAEVKSRIVFTSTWERCVGGMERQWLMIQECRGIASKKLR
jgi:hypothetical protein